MLSIIIVSIIERRRRKDKGAENVVNFMCLPYNSLYIDGR